MGQSGIIVLPSAAEGFVEANEGDVFIADGVGEAELCIEVAALGIKHFDVVDASGAVLFLGEVHIFFRGVA